MQAPAAAAGSEVSAWQLLATSATPTIILCLLGAVGAAMAHTGALDSTGCQVLARMCFYVFTPALTFAKIVQAVSLGTIAHLWPLVANMSLAVVGGLALGLLAARALRAPPRFLYLILLACSLSNVGNFPLVFVATLCHDREAIFYRTLGASCEHLGVAYTAFDIAVATLFQFTLAINLIRRGMAAQAAEADAAGLDAPPLRTAGGRELQKRPTVSDLLRERGGSASPRGSPLGAQQLGGPPLAASPGSPLPLHMQQQQQQWQQQQQQQPSIELSVELQPAEAPSPQQRWQQQQGQKALSGGSDSAHQDDTAALLPRRAADGDSSHDGQAGQAGSGSAGSRGRLARGCGGAWRYARGVDWGALFPLPSQAAFLGVAVGCIEPLKTSLYSAHAPLRVVGEALETLGTGLIPTAIPLLGAVLYRATQSGASRLPLRVTLGVLVAKLIVQPIVMTLLVVAALSLKLFTPPDPMFLLTLLLSNATPTAVNMQTLTVLYQYGEAEMSSLLQWQYLASILTLPAFMWLFLKIIAAWT